MDGYVIYWIVFHKQDGICCNGWIIPTDVLWFA